MNLVNLLGIPGGSPTSLVDAAHEVAKSSARRHTSTPPTPQLFSSSGKILSNTVSWLGGTKSDSSATDATQRETAESLLTSIRRTYGSDIAEKVESFYSSGLTQRGSSSKTLSKETAEKAYALAGFLENSNLSAADLATSQQNLSHVEALGYQAALEVLKSLGLTTEGTELDQRLQTARAEITNPKNKNALLDPKKAETQVLHARSETEELLSAAIQEASLPAAQKKAALANAASSFKKSLVQVLNQQEWPVVETTLEYSLQGKNYSTRSVMTPAGQMSCLQKTYASAGIGGICSGDKKNQDHAINLWIDRLEDDNSSEFASLGETASLTSSEDETEIAESSFFDNQGKAASSKDKPIMTLIRSGVHFPDSVEPSQQEAAFNNRFNEALLASLESKGLLPTDFSTEPIKITIADVGLLTGSIEHAMQQGQFTSLANVNAQTAQGTSRELRYTPPGSNQEITFLVQPTILAFNFGVRKVDKGLLAIATEPSSWRKTNDASFNQLLGNSTSTGIGGLVQDALNDEKRIPPFTKKEKNIIQYLAQQCRDIRTAGSINLKDDDYYAVAARVIVLCDKLGIVPNIHCKSGKDRTSRAVEEAKMLAAEIEATGEVPTRGKLSAERQKIKESFGQSGNAKLQQLNTGIIGNKQGKAFNLRVDNPMAQAFYAGLSAHTAT